MSYSSSSAAAQTRDQVFEGIRTFCLSIGWTDYDDQRASGYYVLYSDGESSDESIYIKIYTYSTAYLYARSYQYWDAAAHAGVHEGSVQTLFYGSSTGTFKIYGDKDAFITYVSLSSVYCYYIGIPDRYDPVKTTTTSSISSGSSVTIPVTDPYGFMVGSKYFIADDTNYDTVYIESVSIAGSTVTVTALDNSYSSGAVIGRSPKPTVILRITNGTNGDVIGTGQGYLSASYSLAQTVLVSRYETYTQFGEQAMIPIRVHVTNYTSSGHYFSSKFLGWLKHVYSVMQNSPGPVLGDIINGDDGNSYEVLVYLSCTFCVRT